MCRASATVIALLSAVTSHTVGVIAAVVTEDDNKHLINLDRELQPANA